MAAWLSDNTADTIEGVVWNIRVSSVTTTTPLKGSLDPSVSFVDQWLTWNITTKPNQQKHSERGFVRIRSVYWSMSYKAKEYRNVYWKNKAVLQLIASLEEQQESDE